MLKLITPRLARSALPLAIAAVLSACATNALDTTRDVNERAQAVSKGPQNAPFRSITGFSESLRCMDNMLLDYGVRDVSVIVEDILDETKKVNAGTKEMFISAVSDMTRRSRAIRPIAYGKDSGNTIGFLFQAQQRDHFAIVPPFGVRGSITQFDDAIVRKNLDGGISVSPYFSIGAANTATASVVGLDMNVLSTQDLSVVAGVSARNSIIVLKDGKGVEGEAAIEKFGINFSVSIARTEGQSQALRTLVELSSIELIGRLARVPYWSCLGATDADPQVQNEVREWYDSMVANPVELIEYFQRQMRARGVYNGPVDGIVNPEIKEAVARYREAFGLSREPKLSLEFFKAYLASNHREFAGRVQPVLATQAAQPVPAAQAVPAAPAASAAAAGATSVTAVKPAAPAAAARLGLKLSTVNNATRFAAGERVQLTVRPSRDAHVYCFMQDEHQKVSRFFPNRFQRDSYISAAQGLQLPGSMRFEIVMNPLGKQESISCIATERDVMADLPAGVAGGDFDPLPVATLGQIRDAFVKVTGGAMAQEYFHVQPK